MSRCWVIYAYIYHNERYIEETRYQCNVLVWLVSAAARLKDHVFVLQICVIDNNVFNIIFKINAHHFI